MRHAIWLTLIGFSLSALAGGFFSGRAAVPRFPRVTTSAPHVSGIPETGEVALDDFADDEAVTIAGAQGNAREDARLAIVLIDAGHSPALEQPFLDLGIPLTLVIDPDGAAAAQMLQAARQDGDSVFVQARSPLQARAVRALHEAYPGASGIAVRASQMRLPYAALRALRANGLALLDEYGENAPVRDEAQAARVRFAARGVTVDDHPQPSYVVYMFGQAVRLARGRRVVVMARPFPGTLQAFDDLLAQATREGVRFVGL